MNTVLRISILSALLLPGITPAQTAPLPDSPGFQAGDNWEWQWVENRRRGPLNAGKQTRTVVEQDGGLAFSSGPGNMFPIRQAFLGKPASEDRPWRVWPLEVGKTWTFESNWVKDDGAAESIRQDARVAAYEAVTVPAGSFKAFRIEYKGTFSSDKVSAEVTDTCWYVPELMADVKIQRDLPWVHRTTELLKYPKRLAP